MTAKENSNLSNLEKLRRQACTFGPLYTIHSSNVLTRTDDFIYADYILDDQYINLTDNSTNNSIHPNVDYYFRDQYIENEDVKTFVHIEKVLYTRVVVAICLFGLIGNIFNLLILVPKGFHFCMGRIEKFANSGLIALAVSDMCFCVMPIPYAFVDLNTDYFASLSFDLFYITYNNALINMFTMASTWLTVTLAIGRYLATCHPLRAREMIGMTIAKWSIIVVCVLCVMFNIPRFWTYKIEEVKCPNGSNVYFKYNGYLKSNRTFDTVYNWIYFVLGITIPLFLLTFSNSYLIRALRNSRATRRLIRAGDTTETSRLITMTLVVIVIMYIALVSPAELITFLREQVLESGHKAYIYNLAVAVVNTLQAINFSFNFVLYCIINASFRRSLVRLLSCGRYYKQKPRPSTRNNWASTYSSTYYRSPGRGGSMRNSTFTSVRLTEV